MLKDNLEEITEKDFIKYVNIIRNSKITNVAPLGFSGDTLIIYETKEKPFKKDFMEKEEYNKLPDGDNFGEKGYYNKPVCRSSELSFRKYLNECELLITDYSGNFLTYSKLNLVFSDEYIGKTFYKMFIDMKPYMNKVVDNIKQEIDFKNVKYSVGFNMLQCLTTMENSRKIEEE